MMLELKNVLIDAAVYSEHGIVIQYNIKPGSVKRSIDH
jgi:hypothetical protein